MLESFSTGPFTYKKMGLEEQQSRGILGRLTGIIADTKNPTRNGRKYSRELWEAVFENPVMQEKIANRCLFGELGHPTDREEVDMTKVAICLSDKPKIGEDGKLYGVFDILSTPNGRILKSLCDYGCNIGVSSRGTGDLYTDEDGNEAVDPDSYNCECWDAVVVPAVESARMQYVHESLDVKKYNKTLRQRLTEELFKASEEDKEIMNEALETLGIQLNESLLWKKDANGSMVEYKIVSCHLDEKGKRLFHVVDRSGRESWVPEEDATKIEKGEYTPPEEPKPEKKEVEPHTEVDGTTKTAEPLVKMNRLEDALQEEVPQPTSTDTYKDIVELIKNNPELKNNDDLRKVVKKAYEEAIKSTPTNEDFAETFSTLMVEALMNESRFGARSDIEALSEEVVDDKSDIKELQESLLKCRQLEKDNLSLQEKLSVCNAKEVKLEEELNRYKTMATAVSDKAHEAVKSSKQLKDLQEKYDILVTESESNKQLVEKLQNQNVSNSALTQELQKQVESLTERLAEESSKANASLKESAEKIKKYQKALKSTREKFVEAKAEAYGVSKNDILQNLNESYKLTDVDSICEKLSDRNRSLSKLPFRVGSNTKIVESVTSRSPIQNGLMNDDDQVSESLLQLINM